jgi:hypothetical protein
MKMWTSNCFLFGKQPNEITKVCSVAPLKGAEVLRTRGWNTVHIRSWHTRLKDYAHTRHARTMGSLHTRLEDCGRTPSCGRVKQTAAECADLKYDWLKYGVGFEHQLMRCQSQGAMLVSKNTGRDLTLKISATCCGLIPDKP